MKRLFLIVVGLAYAVAGTGEGAGQPAAGPHATKKLTREASVSKSASTGQLGFSNASKTMIAQFPEMRTNSTIDQGGISFTAGRESPDAPFTGGLKLRF